jgi:hypothetical protein
VFPQRLVVLLLAALPVSQDEVRGVVLSAARQRRRVIDLGNCDAADSD